MPKINIETSTPHAEQKTYEILQKLFVNDEELKRLDADYTCEFSPENYSAKISGSKFDAKLQVKGQTVAMEIEVPFLLSAFKGKIKDNLEKKLNLALS